jgi:Tfp pilus assembly protein PilF
MGGDKSEGRAMADRIMRIDAVEGYLAQVMLANYDKQENRVEDLLRKAVAAAPSSYKAHMALANFCLGGAKKYAEGETLARKAMTLDPGRTGAHTALVTALIAQDKWAEVDGALAQAESDVPDDLTP